MTAKSKFAKLVAGFVGFAMAFSFVVTPVTASAATAEELQAQINSLLATIQCVAVTALINRWKLNWNIDRIYI